MYVHHFQGVPLILDDELADLMPRACTGDRHALDAIVENSSPFLLSIVRRGLDHRVYHLCEPMDCLQDTLLALFGPAWHAGLFLSVEEMTAYFTVTAVNVVQAAHRRYLHARMRDLRRMVPLAGDMPQRGPTAQEIIDDIDEFQVYLLSVSPEFRRALLLMRDGNSQLEAAKLLGISERKIRHMLADARRKAQRQEMHLQVEETMVRPEDPIKRWSVRRRQDSLLLTADPWLAALM